jgi:hypothetical protein
MLMKHDIEEIVIEAIMCDEPTIIVEGIDDIKFYDNVSKLINIDLNIQAIETIQGYTEGCENVKQAIEDLQDFISHDIRAEKFILGIIDRDARYYRGEIPNLKGLFVLNYYSYESHLVTLNTIHRQICYMTKVSHKMIDATVLEYIYEEFIKGLNKLYYISLEALKTSCNSEYHGVVSYGNEAGNILGYGAIDYIWNQISPKIDELNLFAKEFNICQDDLKYIAKGKWLLFYWCDYITRSVKNLYNLCGEKFPTCPYCLIGKKEKCLWKPEGNFQIPHIKNYLCSKEVIDLDEISYICDRFRLLVS